MIPQVAAAAVEVEVEVVIIPRITITIVVWKILGIVICKAGIISEVRGQFIGIPMQR
jgi:hypothetical protein